MPLPQTVQIPGAADATFQALLIAALSHGVSEISGLRMNNHTHDMLKALAQLGIVAQLEENTASCILSGCAGQLPKRPINLWCGNNKTIAQYLLFTAAAMTGVYYFDGSSALRQQNLLPVIQLLNQLRVQFIPNHIHTLPFTLISTDRLEGNVMVLNKPIPHATIAGLLMLAPFTKQSSTFILSEQLNQMAIDLTCRIMTSFGILIHRPTPYEINIPTMQHYQAQHFIIPSDFKLVLFCCAAAALTNNSLTLQGVSANHLRPNQIKLLALFESIGCQMDITTSYLAIKGPPQMQGKEISLHEWSDAFMVFAMLAPFADSITCITHLGTMNKRSKHCLQQAISILSTLQVPIEYDEQHLIIHPYTPHAVTLDAHHDKRLTLTLSLLRLRLPEMIIKNPATLDKDMPASTSLWMQLFKKPEIMTC